MSGNRRSESHRKSVRVAFCGVMAGLSLVIMLLGGLMRIATYAAPMAAAVLLLPVRIEFGGRWAWGTWLVVTALSLLLGMDKEAGFFYLFIGYWPIVKWPVDRRIRDPRLRLALKVLFFAAATAAMYAVLLFAVGMPELTEDLRRAGLWSFALLTGLTALALLLYDFLLRRLAFLYAQRLRPRLSFLGRPK